MTLLLRPRILVKYFVVVVVVCATDPPSTTGRFSNTPYCAECGDDDDGGVVGHSTFVDAESHSELIVNNLPRPPHTSVQSVSHTSCSYYSRSTHYCG